MKDFNEKQLNVSVVISSLNKEREKNLKRLISEIKRQTLKPKEIIIVKGVEPRTRAHNIGAKKAKGEIIIFFDDDIRLGNEFLIRNLLEPFFSSPKIGIVGAAVILPPDSGLFQKICATQLFRAQFGIVKETIDSDMATHAALAVPRDLYWEIGGEDESLRMNDDLYLRCKIREKGYKVVIAKNAWVYHPQPDNLIKLLKKYFRQGVDQAHDYKLKPELIYESPLKHGELPQKSNLPRQIIRNLKIILGSIVKLKLILLLSRLATGIGFIFGYIRGSSDEKGKLHGEVEIIKFK